MLTRERNRSSRWVRAARRADRLRPMSIFFRADRLLTIESSAMAVTCGQMYTTSVHDAIIIEATSSRLHVHLSTC
jgi:hypothetical protein